MFFPLEGTNWRFPIPSFATTISPSLDDIDHVYTGLVSAIAQSRYGEHDPLIIDVCRRHSLPCIFSSVPLK